MQIHLSCFCYNLSFVPFHLTLNNGGSTDTSEWMLMKVVNYFLKFLDDLKEDDQGLRWWKDNWSYTNFMTTITVCCAHLFIYHSFSLCLFDLQSRVQQPIIFSLWRLTMGKDINPSPIQIISQEQTKAKSMQWRIIRTTIVTCLFTI